MPNSSREQGTGSVHELVFDERQPVPSVHSFIFRTVLVSPSLRLCFPIDAKAKFYRCQSEGKANIYRTSIEDLSNIYRTSIEDLSNIYRTSIGVRGTGSIDPQQMLILWTLLIEDTGTGQCPDCFEIFEMIFLPIPVSRWS